MRKIILSGRTSDDHDITLESEVSEDQTHLELAALREIFKKQGILPPYRQKSGGGGGGNRPGWLDLGPNNLLWINFPYKGSKDANAAYQAPIMAKIKEISKQSPRGEKMTIGGKEEYVFAIGGGKVEVIKAIIALPEFKDFERRATLVAFLKENQ